MKSNKKLIIIVFLSIIWIWLLVGYLAWNIWFEFGNQKVGFPKTYISSLTWIQDIKGQIFITPFGSLDRFSSEVSKTKKILYIQTYDFTEKRLKKLFQELLNKWVEIKLIMENKKYQQFVDTFKQVQQFFSWYKNFAIKSDEQMKTTYTHSKISILDDNFIIQTANLTHSSFFSNREHFFISSDSWVYNSLLTIFNKDREWETILQTDIHPNLVICNLNCRSVIENLLNSAGQSITIQTQYINDPAILEILKKKSNLTTKIIVSDTDANDYLFKYFWPLIVKKIKKPYIHTKIILIDDRILLIWSMNLSANSLDKNREIWILLLDKDLISQFLVQFNKDWKVK